jgi:hypothetical protein
LIVLSFEGRQRRSKVSGRQSFNPTGLVGDAGDLIQIPTHRARRTGGVRQPAGSAFAKAMSNILRHERQFVYPAKRTN